jgi:hypothetical protein
MPLAGELVGLNVVFEFAFGAVTEIFSVPEFPDVSALAFCE